MIIRGRHVVTALLTYTASEVTLLAGTRVTVDRSLLVSLVPGAAAAVWHALIDKGSV